MHLCRVKITNFRNFGNLDVRLGRNAVILGENRVGKSNFIFAIRLVLDARLPDSARQLKITDFWDGCNVCNEPEIRVDIDFTGFESDLDLTALLTDHRLAGDPQTARLSFIFRRKPSLEEVARSEADFEFLIFGGDVETNGVSNQLRRRIALDLLPALRDAESELATWRSSPLRPLLEDAIGRVPDDELDLVGKSLEAATQNLASLDPIRELEQGLRQRIAELAGPSQDLKATLGFAPSDPLRALRTIGLFIDDGKRGISEASAGSANIALLSLKFAEFSWRALKNERDYTLLCVEEPEAHLHPHLQRQVFRRIFNETAEEPRGLVLTTHSPHIASVAPLDSIVVIKDSNKGSRAFSLAKLHLDDQDLEDLERYINSSRAELLFSRAVVFVEGDAEVALVPVFADSIGHNLDQLGITVCSVAGVNFAPYVKLAVALNLPFAVITDWDPITNRQPLGWTRASGLLSDIRKTRGMPPFSAATLVQLQQDEAFLRSTAEAGGIFINNATFEVEVANTPSLLEPLITVLEEVQFGATRQQRLSHWRSNPDALDPSQLLLMVGDVGKGRFAGRLAAQVKDLQPPSYIARAIEYTVQRA